MLRLAASYEGKVWHYALPRAPATLGSDADNELVLPAPGVSRRHVTVERVDGGVRLVDLGSKNGILLDGARLERAELRRGTTVRLGRAVLRVEDVPSSEIDIAVVLAAKAAGPAARRERSTSSTGDGATTSEVSPVVALDLIRRIEQQGLGSGQARQAELLEACRRLLEARWLAVLALPIPAAAAEEPAAFLAYAGSLPDDEEMAHLRAALAGTSTATPPAGDLLCHLAADARVALALRRQDAGPVRPWQLDFFDFLASKVGSSSSPSGGRNRRSPRTADDLVLPPGFVPGPSPAMTRLLTSIRATVHSGLDVLLIGETGTGKELVARLVHGSGSTSAGPFIAINCAAIPADLLEAELFGVEGRVATGVDPRPGLFVRAEGGTLFLDEIGDMSEPMQAKLLRALQEREVLPIGAHRPKRINVRVVSASNKPLAELVRGGRFRADLYYRLRGLQFHLPPLRERLEDVPALVAYFATAASERYGKPVRGVSRRVLELLVRHDWPGNVRELRNEVERAVLLAEDHACLEERHFASIRWQIEHGPGEAAAAPPAPPSASPGAPRSLAERVDELERQAIREALAVARQNKSRAARLLGITRNGLALKLKRLGLEERG